MPDQYPKYVNQIIQDEHDNSSEPKTKRVLLYGWDTSNQQKTKLAVSSDGLILSSLLDGYSMSDFDTSSDPSYIGYTDASGAWYIIKMTNSTGQCRYVKGASGYATAWTNRASQTYDYYYNVF